MRARFAALLDPVDGFGGDGTPGVVNKNAIFHIEAPRLGFRCDHNLSTFLPKGYTGTWHEVEGIPKLLWDYKTS